MPDGGHGVREDGYGGVGCELLDDVVPKAAVCLRKCQNGYIGGKREGDRQLSSSSRDIGPSS